jgi:hypothetical protein
MLSHDTLLGLSDTESCGEFKIPPHKRSSQLSIQFTKLNEFGNWRFLGVKATQTAATTLVEDTAPIKNERFLNQ